MTHFDSDPNKNTELAIMCSIARFTSTTLHVHFPQELMNIVCSFYTVITDDNIHEAVLLWFKNKKKCIKKYGHISHWDTSKVTSMNNLFGQIRDHTWYLKSRVSLDVPLYWNTSNVTDMDRMFYCSSFAGKGMEDWDVSKVVTMEEMFAFTHRVKADLRRWNTGSVMNMCRMFIDAEVHVLIDRWNVSQVRNFEKMFQGCTKFDQPLQSWRLDNAENCHNMFCCCTKLNQDFSMWKLPHAKTLEGMFMNCFKFEQIPYDWDWGLQESSVNTDDMFFGCGKKLHLCHKQAAANFRGISK